VGVYAQKSGQRRRERLVKATAAQQSTGGKHITPLPPTSQVLHTIDTQPVGYEG
jgi:hypothetical protein